MIKLKADSSNARTLENLRIVSRTFGLQVDRSPRILLSPNTSEKKARLP